ncbi:MAG: hypothetical protein AAF236_09800 [Verrucomicrobiota bacterium]
MRAVALGDETVQHKIAENFIPLKISMEPGAADFPLDWPAMEAWRVAYQRLGGEESEGFTCCSVVSPDLEVEYGNTGSAMVWELFDSIAYDPAKFAAMLDRAVERAEVERSLKASPGKGSPRWRIARARLVREVKREGRFRLPPPGFSVDNAKEIFEMTGDLSTEQ